MKNFFLLLCLAISYLTYAQPYNFSYTQNTYNNIGQRACMADATVDLTAPSITIHFRDASWNSTDNVEVYRRPLHGDGSQWVLQASLSPGTTDWADTNVSLGDAYDYQIKRKITGSDDATSYLTAGIDYDQTDYKGQYILLVDETLAEVLATEIFELHKDLTGEGWFVHILKVARVAGWNGGADVVAVKQSIQAIYNNAPINDKPTHLFILGHAPVPRSGLDLQPPDGHTPQSTGARGADTYYADLDGNFTDVATYDVPGMNHPDAANYPGDFKWDQDHIPSELELSFGRVDFEDLFSISTSEEDILKDYLNRLHQYRHGEVVMGRKTGFYYGYDNSNDGSIRSLIPISGVNEVYNVANANFPQQVQNTGPYQFFMQNQFVPSTTEWTNFGMDATIFSSDQSYWGFWASAEQSGMGTIRSILARPSKCVATIWSTTAVNVFHSLGLGETIGFTCKRIMDHNAINNIYEKPEADWDTQDWWNRTHMQLNGDPSIRLFQVLPASNLSNAVISNTQVELNWTASADNVIGYHVYKSADEFGIYTKLTIAGPVTGTTFTDNNFTNNGEWYMVRAIKRESTGSGSYMNPSIGIFTKAGLFTSSTNLLLDNNCIQVYPCPATNYFVIEGQLSGYDIKILDVSGNVLSTISSIGDREVIDISELGPGTYFIEAVNMTNSLVSVHKFLKM